MPPIQTHHPPKMTQSNLLRLHITSLQRSCIALSNAAERRLPDGAAAAKTLYSLAGRLPGPIDPQAETETPDSLPQSLALIRGARASLSYLTHAGQFSDLGLRIADAILAALDSLQSDFGRELRKDAQRKIRGLYVIIDPLVTGDRPPEYIAEQALEGGAAILQLRDKTRDKGLSMPLARRLTELCREKDALLIINDHADLAAAVEAHGVHVGQDDLPVESARMVLNDHQIVGRSNHHADEALASQAQGADYIAVGAMYPTGSKNQPIVEGPPLVSAVKNAIDLPVVAIGGITAERAPEVVRRGADAICVISAVGAAPNPRDAAGRLVEAIINAGGRA